MQQFARLPIFVRTFNCSQVVYAIRERKPLHTWRLSLLLQLPNVLAWGIHTIVWCGHLSIDLNQQKGSLQASFPKLTSLWHSVWTLPSPPPPPLHNIIAYLTVLVMCACTCTCSQALPMCVSNRKVGGAWEWGYHNATQNDEQNSLSKIGIASNLIVKVECVWATNVVHDKTIPCTMHTIFK